VRSMVITVFISGPRGKEPTTVKLTVQVSKVFVWKRCCVRKCYQRSVHNLRVSDYPYGPIRGERDRNHSLTWTYGNSC
jgi:hypothetical protein